MINYGKLDDVKLQHTAVALGKFDGLHKGHQLLFDKLAFYKKQGFKAVIFTFDFHPASLLTGKRQQVIYTREERHRIVESLGADILIEYPFTDQTAHMKPEEFVKNILVDIIGTERIVVGNDFHFGYKRSGNLELLRSNEEKFGYIVDSCEKVCMDGEEISATRIRNEIRDGNMEYANLLLGRPYSVSGYVAHGKENGRKVNMPTANIMTAPEKLIPPDGVYASRTYIDGSEKAYFSVTNIGTNPTVGDNNDRSVETFLMDFDGDLYDRQIRVEIFKRIRGEEKFDSLISLKKQVDKDKQTALAYLEAL